MNNQKVSFKFVSLNETLNGVKISNPKKASQATDITIKTITENKDLVSLYVFPNFNNLLSSSSFPTALKHADVRPMFKKDNRTDKENIKYISTAWLVSWYKKLFLVGQLLYILDFEFPSYNLNSLNF